jgi:hypothetical protein
MRYAIQILFSTCLLIVTYCSSQIKTPKNLDEAILYFQQKWAKDDMEKFKNESEEYAVAELGLAPGMWIRNNWVYGNRNRALKKYFDSLGIRQPDDISSIILTSLHRTLNQKDIQLDKQVRQCQAYWKAIIDCDEKEKLAAISIYSKFKVGDRIMIYMPVETVNGSRLAVMYGCPLPEWTFDPQKDLLIKGRIVKKYFIKQASNVFFTIHITFLNRNDTPVLMTKVKVGQNKEFSLKGLTVQ